MACSSSLARSAAQDGLGWPFKQRYAVPAGWNRPPKAAFKDCSAASQVLNDNPYRPAICSLQNSLQTRSDESLSVVVGISTGEPMQPVFPGPARGPARKSGSHRPGLQLPGQWRRLFCEGVLA